VVATVALTNSHRPSRTAACCPAVLSLTALAAESSNAKTNSAAKAAVPRLVDLGADKCIPCRMMAPILKELKKDYEGQMEVEFIDVWKDPEAGKPYKINLIPTQIFFDQARKELFRHEGYFSKQDILAKWKELGVTFKAPK
jgi:thioredoxin 1